MEYKDKKILIGLSGGINSAAVLVRLSLLPEKERPEEVHLYYAHFIEHSPDTLDFVLACRDYAKKYFKKLVYVQTNNSVLDYFRNTKMIPHPVFSPCSVLLKIAPMQQYMKEQGLDLDMIGFVKEEKHRADRMRKKHPGDSVKKVFPIIEESNEWCFEYVKSHIGWYPRIYDMRDKDGKRVFKHNNCLPCKNMSMEQLKDVAAYYPDYMERAIALSQDLKKYWGRDAQAFYTEFGREDYEAVPCATCAFD